MKFYMQQGDLRRALSIVIRGVPNKTPMEILTSVLIVAKDGVATFTTTDLTIGIVYSAHCKVDKEGSICIPAKMLLDVVNNLPAELVYFQLSDNASIMHVSCGKYSTELRMFLGEEYPALPDDDAQTVIGTVVSSSLKNALNQVTVCAATDNSRPVLTGVFMEIPPFDESNVISTTPVKISAADGYRLAQASITMNRTTPDEQALIIPSTALVELTKMLAYATSDVELIVLNDNNSICFRASTDDGIAKVIARLIDGKYPDVQRVIPTDMPTRVVASKSDILKAIRMSKLFVNKQSNSVQLSISSMFMDFQANSDEKGKNSCMVDILMTGEPMHIALNVQYFEDAVSSIDADEIAISLRNNASPALFQFGARTESSDKEYKHVVMPVMVR